MEASLDAKYKKRDARVKQATSEVRQRTSEAFTSCVIRRVSSSMSCVDRLVSSPVRPLSLLRLHDCAILNSSLRVFYFVNKPAHFVAVPLKPCTLIFNSFS